MKFYQALVTTILSSAVVLGIPLCSWLGFGMVAGKWFFVFVAVSFIVSGIRSMFQDEGGMLDNPKMKVVGVICDIAAISVCFYFGEYLVGGVYAAGFLLDLTLYSARLQKAEVVA